MRRGLISLSVVLVAVVVFLILALDTRHRRPYSPSGLDPIRHVVQGATFKVLKQTNLAPDLQKQLQSAAVVRLYGRTIDGVRWPTHQISVCWENPDPAYATEMQWSQDAVKRSWEANSVLTFPGWGPCALAAPGVHLKIADVPPEAIGVGTQLNIVPNGVILNFDMKAVRLKCTDTREACIRTVAVHEFGHVIGLVHEDFNDGAPCDCLINAQGPQGNKDPTGYGYDKNSVMNYCNDDIYFNNGALSAIDIQTVNDLYPKSG